MRQKRGVRDWGISEKGTGTREGEGCRRECRRGRQECVGGVAVKMERREAISHQPGILRYVIFHNYATLSGISKIKSYFTSAILSAHPPTPPPHTQRRADTRALSLQFNMENIEASLRALVSLRCHSLLNKTGMQFPRWESRWTAWGPQGKKPPPVATKSRKPEKDGAGDTSCEGHLALFHLIVLSVIKICQWLLENDVQLPIRWLLSIIIFFPLRPVEAAHCHEAHTDLGQIDR